jgi:hypothetical protein
MREARANLRSSAEPPPSAAGRDARWRQVQTQMRRDVVRLLQRLEKAVAPGGGGAPRARASAPRRKKR